MSFDPGFPQSNKSCDATDLAEYTSWAKNTVLQEYIDEYVRLVQLCASLKINALYISRREPNPLIVEEPIASTVFIIVTNYSFEEIARRLEQCKNTAVNYAVELHHIFVYNKEREFHIIKYIKLTEKFSPAEVEALQEYCVCLYCKHWYIRCLCGSGCTIYGDVDLQYYARLEYERVNKKVFHDLTYK